ncbi:MAG: RNA polymerase factor sigma-54 [Bacillota bacterium]|nr:RNA polymerase factor sigma-54 [Bacillota bacterium]
MALDQLLRLAQTLNLSPALLQSMRILQMNTQELSDYLNDLAMENPAMEYDEGPGSGPSWEEFSSRVPWLADRPSAGWEGEPPADVGTVADRSDSLEVLLRDQLTRLHLEPPLLALCQYLADSLDPKGRLEQSDLDGLARAGVPEALLTQAVETLQALDPPGIAARSLEECLVLQLRRMPGDHQLAIRLCGHLEALAQGTVKLKALADRLGADPEQLRQAVEVIRTLNPNPVGDMTPEEPIRYLRPDAWVAEVDGQLQVFVNQWDLPRFAVSRDYLAMAKTGREDEAADYLREKIQQAQWVLQCVRRRQATLEACLTALVKAQENFFLGRWEAPGPLLRRELAEQLEVHPSTVTRTLGHKYIQCRQGLFPTAYFFSRKTGGDQSEQALKARIARMVREEDPAHPLSDQTITQRLAEEGISLARRTVAKYRLALGIPSSQQRRSR